MIWLLLICVAWLGAGIFVAREEIADVIRAAIGGAR